MNDLSDNLVIVTPPMLADMPELFAPLAACGLQVVFHSEPHPMKADKLVQCLGGAVAVVVGLDEVSASVFERCPNLRIVARNGVGLDTVDVAAATRHGVAVTAPLGANSTSVAELAFGLLITLARGIVANHNRVQAGFWRRDQGHELAGKTLGIIGLGRIGKKVARRALAFDMLVIAHDILPDEAFATAHGIRFVSRETLLAEADIVSLHVPLTELTADMLNDHTFATMKPGAFLINTARGPIVNADALVAALDSGRLAGAALDVHPIEGQIDCRLVDRPNVVTTTHLGAYTHEALAATTQAAMRSLCQFFSHQTPDGWVNPEVVPHPVSRR